MVKPITVDNLLQTEPGSFVLLDVRSPSEHAQGHIPGAVGFPLFTDEERAEVGIAYKNISPERAMQIGLEIVGPKMNGMLTRAKKLSGGKALVVHCWRGGKRSGSVGWFLDFAGLNVSVLEGGYKAYRTHQRSWLTDSPFNLIVLGGKTGSGKTELLQALADRGEQVLNLEGLAHHKGSAFGWIGEEDQPSTEQFENDIFDVLRKMDVSRPIWLENESLTIGKVFIPQSLWQKMKCAPLVHLEVPIDTRIRKLVEDYAGTELKEALITSFEKISARLGGQHLKAAIEALEKGNYHDAAEIALTYYDKAYYYGLEQSTSPMIEKIETAHMSKEQIIDTLMAKAYQLHTHTIQV